MPVVEDYGFILGLGAFLSSVDQAYLENDDKVRMAIRNLEISSEELNTLNEHLEDLNRQINAMLNGLGQGLFFFNQEGICSNVFSRISVDLFGGNPAGKYFPELLGLDTEQSEDFAMWLSVVFDRSIPVNFDDLKKLAPRHLSNKDGRFIELDYAPLITIEKKVGCILCIATDKTFEETARKDLEKKEEEVSCIRSVASNRDEFSRFVNDMDGFITFLEKQKNDPDDIEDILAILHGVKGQAGVFHFIEFARTVHELENVIKDYGLTAFQDVISGQTEKIVMQKAAIEALALSVFGDGFRDNASVVSVDYDRLIQFRDALVNVSSADIDSLIQDFDDSFLKVSFGNIIKPFRFELQRVAVSQNKPPIVVSIVDNGIAVPLKVYDDVFDSLMHLARNIVDHGIETPDERRSRSKDEQGNVIISLSRPEEGFYRISICDDGRGLSFEAIRDKLKSMGKYNSSETEEETIQHIFDADFTTKSHVSVLSGRGVGMYALKQSVEKYGGTIRAANGAGACSGAEFHIDLPVQFV